MSTLNVGGLNLGLNLARRPTGKVTIPSRPKIPGVTLTVSQGSGSRSRSRAVTDDLTPSRRVTIASTSQDTSDKPTREELRRQVRESSTKYINTLAALPRAEVEGVKFSFYSPEEIDAMSVLEITSKATEGPDSVMSTRLGTVDPQVSCSTCGGNFEKCPGHFGHINLPVPYIHPAAITIVTNILSSVCNECGALLVSKEDIRDIRKSGANGLTDIKTKAANQLCRGTGRCKTCKRASSRCECTECGTCGEDKGTCECAVPTACRKNQVYKKGVNDLIQYEVITRGKKELVPMPVERVYEILDAISDEDAELLGFSGNNHPRNLIMRKLLVIPVAARPPRIRDQIWFADQLTTTYSEIVGKCINIRRFQEEGKTNSEEYKSEVTSLGFKIAHMINNSDENYKQGQQQPVESMKERLDGKEGAIRGANQGKRVNKAGRTVASPYMLEFGQVRIPEAMRKDLTVIEPVYSLNIDKLQRLVDDGQVTTIIYNEGEAGEHQIHVTSSMLEAYRSKIQAGEDVSEDSLKLRIRMDKNGKLIKKISVERWLQEGDYVLINRQPTLHMESMMAYQVTFGEGLTIGMHLSVTSPLNLDPN